MAGGVGAFEYVMEPPVSYILHVPGRFPTRVKLCSNDDFSSVVCESAVEEDSALISSPHGFFHAKLANSILYVVLNLTDGHEIVDVFHEVSFKKGIYRSSRLDMVLVLEAGTADDGASMSQIVNAAFGVFSQTHFFGVVAPFQVKHALLWLAPCKPTSLVLLLDNMEVVFVSLSDDGGVRQASKNHGRHCYSDEIFGVDFNYAGNTAMQVQHFLKYIQGPRQLFYLVGFLAGALHVSNAHQFKPHALVKVKDNAVLAIKIVG